MTSPTTVGVRLDQRLPVTQARVIRSEWTKLWSLRSTKISLLAAVLITIGLGVLVTIGTATNLGPPDSGQIQGFPLVLVGTYFSPLVIGFLGVMTISGEYSTGMIRSTLSAAPRRLPVLWAKVLVFGVVSFVTVLVSHLITFFICQPIMDSVGVHYSLGDPGVIRALLGAAFYVAAIGVIGVGLGTLLRNTAGGASVVVGLVFVVPVIAQMLPAWIGEPIAPYLPTQAGQALMELSSESNLIFSPWGGLAVLAAWAAAALIGGALVLTRRDA